MTRPRLRWLALWAAALALPAPALAGPARRIHGLERPAARLRWNLPHDRRGQPGQIATRTCLVFARWAVLSSDEGEMGVDDLELRARPRGMSAKRACAADFAGRAVRPRLDEALEPLGVFDRWLVAEAPDDFGVLGTFFLVDLATGELAYTDEYEAARGLHLGRSRGVVLEYWARLTGLTCLPRRGDAACWARTREELRLPARLPAPDCQAVLRALPALQPPPEGPEAGLLAQVTVHVRVRKLARDRAAVLLDRPSCAPAP